jgi:hypothetical protein
VLARRITTVFDDAGGDDPSAQRAAAAQISASTYASKDVSDLAQAYTRELTALVEPVPRSETELAAQKMMGVMEARQAVEDACSRNGPPSCGSVKTLLADAANLGLTEPAERNAFVARMDALSITDPALIGPFAAWRDAERALAAATPQLAAAASAAARTLKASSRALDALNRRYEELCGPAPWR